MTLQEEALAQKYAQAFLHIFGDRVTQDILEAMDKFISWYEKDRHQLFYVRLSGIPSQIKSDLVLKLCDHFGLQLLLQPLVRLLGEQGRLLLLITVLKHIIMGYNEQQGIVDVDVISTYPLSTDEQKYIKEFLERIIGKIVHPQLHVDTRLIAGIRLQSETFLWERSIAQQLRALRSSV